MRRTPRSGCTWCSWRDTAATGLSNVVRRPDAAAIVRDAGGDVVLGDGEDLAEQVLEATGAAAIRLGIDAVSGAATGRLADCLCESATLVSYGRMSGEPCAMRPDAFVFRDLTLRGRRRRRAIGKDPHRPATVSCGSRRPTRSSVRR